ncbi:MAG: 3-hydroxyacyl-CoA dehydrogenase NAD-binding domain-containing protein, partial [Nocardioides sp.]
MSRPDGPVLVIGAGLLGTSIGLALRRQGVDVALSDLHPAHVEIAVGLGAANLDAAAVGRPALVVVAVPPDALAAVSARALRD